MAKSGRKNDNTDASPATSVADRSKDLDSLMNEASEALARGEYFDCERLADEALHRAWKTEQFELMARICLPLQEARRQRRIEAVESKKLHMIEEDDEIPGADDQPLDPGCYVVHPPRVGADARQIRINGLNQEVPVIAVAREPKTQMGLLPVVVVGPTSLRTKIKPPKKMTPSWCLKVIDALTNEGLACLDRTRPLAKQVDVLVDLLDALPESEQLHQELADVAHAAAREAAGQASPSDD